MIWCGIDCGEWDTLARAAPLQQFWLWGEVLAAAGARVERQAARGADGTLLGLAQVTTRRFGPVALSLVSRGPVWIGDPPPRPRLQGLRRQLAAAGPRALVVAPDAGRPARAIPLLTPAWHAELDLTPSLGALRQGLHGKFRNTLARTERARLCVQRDDRRPEHYRWLLKEEAKQARTRGYRGYPPELVSVWHRLGGAVRMWVARRGDARIGAMLFLLHGKVATYQIGWAGAEGRRAAAHTACLWRAVTELEAEGIERIDLGTVDTDAAPGLARFKIGTGAAVRPLGATYLVSPF